jgi:MoxR-like ATPase
MTSTPASALTPAGLASIDAITEALASVGYISTRAISTSVYLAHHLRKPVLIEGPAGVGKTDLAVSLAKAMDWALLRMPCYEGLDDSKALYEWKYGKQLLYTQILKEKIGLLIDGADNLQQAVDGSDQSPDAPQQQDGATVERVDGGVARIAHG